MFVHVVIVVVIFCSI